MLKLLTNAIGISYIIRVNTQRNRQMPDLTDNELLDLLEGTEETTEETQETQEMTDNELLDLLEGE